VPKYPPFGAGDRSLPITGHVMHDQVDLCAAECA